MFGSLKIDGQRKGMWWDTAWGGALSAPPAQDELIQWLYDYSGDFVLLDKVDPQFVTVPDVVGVNVLSFPNNDPSDFVQTDIYTPSVDFTASIDYKSDGTTPAYQALIESGGLTTSARGLILQIRNTGALYFRVSNGVSGTYDVDVSSTVTTIMDGASHKVTMKFTKDDLTFRFYFDDDLDNEIMTGTVSEPVVDIHPWTLGADTKNSIQPLAGSIANFYCSNTLSLPMEEGYGRTVHASIQDPLKDIELIILNGQSVLRRPSEDAPPPSGLDQDQEDWIFSYNIENDLYKGTQEYLNSLDGDREWGMELAMCNGITSNFGAKKRAVLKIAKNGRLMSDYVEGNPVDLQVREAVDDCISYLNSNGYHPTVTHYLQDTGYSDASIEVDANAYKTNFDAWYDAMLSDGYFVDAKLIMVQSRADDRLYIDTVRAYQAAIVAERDGILLDIDAALKVADNVHLTTAGTVTYGEIAASSIIDYQTRGTVYTSGNNALIMGSPVWTKDDDINISQNLRNGYSPEAHAAGGSFFESRITLDATCKWRIGYYFDDTTRNQRHGFATTDADGRLYIGINAGSFIIGNGNGTPLGAADTLYHEAEFNLGSGQVFIDGALVSTRSGLNDFSEKVIIFAHGPANDLTVIGGVFFSEIEKNGVVVERLVSDGNGNMLDLITGDTITSGLSPTEVGYVPPIQGENGLTDAKGYLPIGVRGSVEGAREHNGCEVGFRATDAWFSNPANIPNVYHDGTNPVDRYYSDMIAHPNGKYGMYQKSEKDTGTLEMCILKESGQYPTDWAPTPAQYQQGIKYWTVCSSFADSLVPYPINSGDGIGPDGGWYPIDGDKVYLVEDV